MSEARLLACDWGTTNLRAWTLDETGGLVASRDFPLGVSRLMPGEAARRFALEVRPALAAEDLPAILCGMIGSNLGWTTAPYAPCPTGLDDLRERLIEVDNKRASVRIVPGVVWDGFNGRGDVMRGEETQLFGWMTRDPSRALGRHLVCHPGTHTKWMRVEEGRLTGFVTAMTGELFALLRTYSVLHTQTPPDDMAAFDEGVEAAGAGDGLAARLFTARARVVGKNAPVESSSSYLSGLLVGADVAATPRLLGHGAAPSSVTLLGDAHLCSLYARALSAAGVDTSVFDGEAAAIAGLVGLHRAKGQR